MDETRIVSKPPKAKSEPVTLTLQTHDYIKIGEALEFHG